MAKRKKKKRASPGQPTRYRAEYAEQVEKLCLLGMIDTEIAAFFGVDPTTYYLWQKKHRLFKEAIHRGKTPADARVADALFQRATGCVVTTERKQVEENRIGEKTITKTVTYTTKEEVPPSEKAAQYWLKNRRPDLWRDKHEVEADHTGEIRFLWGDEQESSDNNPSPI